MLDELNETTTVPFGYLWEPNPLDPHEPTLVFAAPQADLCWCLEWEQALRFVSNLSQDMAAKLQAHPRRREWVMREVEEMFQREVETRLTNRTNQPEPILTRLRRWLTKWV